MNSLLCRFSASILLQKKPKLFNLIKPALFSTTPRKEAIPPLIWLVVKPIAKLTSFVFGRSFRQWWRGLPATKKLIFSSHLNRNKHRYGLLLGSSSIGSFAFYQTHLQENAITGRKRFILFTKDQIESVSTLGYHLLMESNKNKLVDPSSKMAKRALNVANRLIDANKTLPGVGEIKWSVNIIDSDMVNAVAFPVSEISS